jgi:hypothetical protein
MMRCGGLVARRGWNKWAAILVVAILVQSICMIALYERYYRAINHSKNDAANIALSQDDRTLVISEPSRQKEPAGVTWVADQEDKEGYYIGRNFQSSAHHNTPINPGGLILSASFSYMQDPREVHRRKPLPHILPTFESMYHFHTTVNHYNLHAIIFHDEKSFNETFVKKYTTDSVKFVLVEEPHFDSGEPIISPNDFRYVVFDQWLKANSQINKGGGKNNLPFVNGVNYNWFLIADLDVFFNTNPFQKLDEYASQQNLTFIGSFDGGIWGNEQVSLQRKLFRNW